MIKDYYAVWLIIRTQETKSVQAAGNLRNFPNLILVGKKEKVILMEVKKIGGKLMRKIFLKK